ncbi:hypothetical protein [Butyrivibrio sp. LC3010]|uniref:hypothetical protein n=1 Tax=Butyrivibrio sp. LC3010 TaxID=1280680 RepID=UPI0003FCEFF7|nr:hypothetical protein [Butyrivibrio sp. LC3010]
MRTGKGEIAPERTYNANMTEEEVGKFTNDMAGYSYEFASLSAQMAELTQKYASILNESEKFDWSQYDDFREIAAKMESLCDEVITYDDSYCSKEYQLVIDEYKGIFHRIKDYYKTISCEIETQRLVVLAQQIDNDVSVGTNNATVYLLMATAAYMESNGASQDKIDAVLESVKDTNIYKEAKGISTTGTSSQKSAYNTVFTNSYGTPDTKCEHAGCNNTIASSGNTNCCVIHSNKCLNCGKYIDEDAMFCMDCLSGKTTSIENTGKYTAGNVPSGGCQYKYFDGSLCGVPTNNYATLCDEHFKQLNDTYNAYVGK